MAMFGGNLNLDPSIERLQMPPVAAQPAAPKKGGMFGSGGGWVDAVQAALAGYLASRGNPVGVYGLQTLQQKRQQALEEAKYQSHRKDDMSDWIAQQSWKQANRGPSEVIQRIQDLNAYKPGLGDTYATNYAQSGGSPFGPMFTDPSTGQRYMMGNQGLPQIGSVIDDPRKQGGPMPQASGGFPSSGY